MSIRVNEVIKQCRNSILMDTDTDAPLWTDFILLNHLVSATRELLKLKPRLLIDPTTGASGSSDEIVSNIATDGEIPLPITFHEALVQGICSRAYISDSSDEYNAGRAQYHAFRFKELCGVKIPQQVAK